MNQKGQALVESVLVLPVVILFFVGILYSTSLTMSFYLIDHWVYQAHLCLGSSESTPSCKHKMLKSLNTLPATQFHLHYFYKNDSYTRIKIESRNLWLPSLNFDESYKLPLSSKDFNRFGFL